MKRTNPRFPDYEIRDDGRVFRVRYGKSGKGSRSSKIGSEVKGRILQSGYRQFKLVRADGTKALVRANRLIAETFFGPAPTTVHQCAHSDGDRLNNHVNNLRWATPKENNADKGLHGTENRGSANPRAKFTDSEIAEIRSSLSGKRGEIVTLAKKYAVGKSTMNRIVHGVSYSPVGLSALEGRK